MVSQLYLKKGNNCAHLILGLNWFNFGLKNLDLSALFVGAFLTFNASRLLLISAPSSRVCRSALDVSAPRSFPARSINENLPCIFPFLRRIIWKTAWLRDEWAFAEVWPDVLEKERWMIKNNDVSILLLSYGEKEAKKTPKNFFFSVRGWVGQHKQTTE